MQTGEQASLGHRAIGNVYAAGPPSLGLAQPKPPVPAVSPREDLGSDVGSGFLDCRGRRGAPCIMAPLPVAKPRWHFNGAWLRVPGTAGGGQCHGMLGSCSNLTGSVSLCL